ncbi:hypothetical protein GWA97_00245 [Flavobacterium sp. LaA7.5]|nr:hypothetical protein [Flavobacterium salilacus subsp. altitudinum]
MKSILKLFVIVATLFSLFLFFSCDTEERVETQSVSPHELHPSLVSIDEVLAKINSPKIKNTINSLTNPNLKSKLDDFENPEYFERLTLTGHYDQYNLYLKGYTREKPYFLYYIVTIDTHLNEKSGYLKYTPEKDSISLDMRIFTGTLQLLNDDMELVTEANMQQGQVTSSLGTTECIDTVVVVTHPCTNGDEHLPGESCSGGLINDAYYSFNVFTDCWTEFDYSSPGNFIGGGGGGGGVPYTEAFYNSLASKEQVFLDQNLSLKDAVFDDLSNGGGWSVLKKLVEVCSDGYISVELAIDLTDLNNDWTAELLDYLSSNSYSSNSKLIASEFANTTLGYNMEVNEQVFDALIAQDIQQGIAFSIIHFSLNNVEAAKAVFDYVMDNGNSPASIIEAQQIIDNYENIENTLVFVGPTDPIADMEDYLECFDLNQGASLTIFVDQPIANSNIVVFDSVGHTFVGITQGDNKSVFGFYPNGSAGPLAPSDPSMMGDDGSHSWDVSITINVSAGQLQQIINYSIDYPATYNLNTYNCTDFGIDIANMANLNLPPCNSHWGAGSGSNPAKLGQHIRNNYSTNSSHTVNKDGGFAPVSLKMCN